MVSSVWCKLLCIRARAGDASACGFYRRRKPWGLQMLGVTVSYSKSLKELKKLSRSCKTIDIVITTLHLKPKPLLVCPLGGATKQSRHKFTQRRRFYGRLSSCLRICCQCVSLKLITRRKRGKTIRPWTARFLQKTGIDDTSGNRLQPTMVT